MNRCVIFCLGLLVLWSISNSDIAHARRGNPANNNSAPSQFYIVDSDDDHPRAPVPYWVDTVYNYAQWTRVTGFTGNDDGSALVKQAGNWNFSIPNDNFAMFSGAISTNGTIALQHFDKSIALTSTAFAWSNPNNKLLPLSNFLDTFAVLAPLWGDWELRTAGDSTKIFYRITSDSLYVSFYNLALKGTEGKVRATFQVAMAKDSTITYQYRSFDGTYAGKTAEELIQRQVTIGMGGSGTIGSNYIHRGHFYATSAGSSQYAKNLHDGLAIRFFRVKNNLITARSIQFPTTENQELASSNFTFSAIVSNWTNEEEMVYLKFEVKNLSSGTTVTTKEDSVTTYGGFNALYSGPTYQGLGCGAYQVTLTIRVPRQGTDPWTHDNVLRRNFYVMTGQSFPFYEQFNSTLSGCAWANVNAKIEPAADVMYDPVAPRSGSDGALVLDRLDANGLRYLNQFAGDTLTSAPIDMSGKSNVYLNFSYQRGLKSDQIKAGVRSTLLTGPEATIFDGGNIIQHPDTLVVEGLLSTGTKWNPTAASWTVLHTITGGIDLKTNKVRIKLPSNMISDHFRFRFRMKSRDNATAFGYPHDDNDSWVIDGVQVISPAGGQTELEITSVDLGTGVFTQVPRDVRFVRPRVTIGNNGRNTGLGSYLLRMIIRDQLNREVYHKTQSFIFPTSFGDTTIAMQDWEIKGSQGGVFSIKTFFEQNFSEIYRANDTNITTRAVGIGDVYALDDGTADTVGSLVAAPLEWYYDFVPLTNDSVRGADMYFLSAQGATSWQFEFRRAGNLIGSRQFSVTPTDRGWWRGSFASLYLPADTIRVHVTQTVGTGIGGDASRGLIFQRTTEPAFTPLFPQIVERFRGNNETPFYGGSSTVANGGVLIPMMRFVYTGSLQFLPVELIRFAGERAGNSVVLTWKTASEENSRGFSIERESFGGWDLIADVNAQNARLGAQYAAEDKTAPLSDVTYRLTSHDLDGSSKVIGTVKIGPSGSDILELQVYPNPASSMLSVNLSGQVPEEVVLRDALGRDVLNVRGVSQLDVSSLAAGNYFLQVSAKGQQFVRAITITR